MISVWGKRRMPQQGEIKLFDNGYIGDLIIHFNGKRNMIKSYPNFCRAVYLDIFLYWVFAYLWTYFIFSFPQGLFCVYSFLSESIFKRDYFLSCLWYAIQLVTATCPGPGHPIFHCTLLLFHMLICSLCLFWAYPSYHVFILWAICYLPGTLAWLPALSSGHKGQVGSLQIPNSKAFQSLPFIWEPCKPFHHSATA